MFVLNKKCYWLMNFSVLDNCAGVYVSMSWQCLYINQGKVYTLIKNIDMNTKSVWANLHRKFLPKSGIFMIKVLKFCKFVFFKQLYLALNTVKHRTCTLRLSYPETKTNKNPTQSIFFGFFNFFSFSTKSKYLAS
jgi:hypothetical protein